MTYPTIPLGYRTQIAPGADLRADPDTYTWQTITTDLKSGLGIYHKRGGDDEEAESSSEFEVVLRDNDRTYDPDNPESILWPHWAQDCPIRQEIALDGVTWQKLCTQYVSEITHEWVDGSSRLIHTHVRADGMLRRLGQGEDLASALRRSMAGVAPHDYVPYAYWPMEDGEDATQFASGLPSGLPMTFNGTVSPAADDTLPGSDALPQFAVGSMARFNVPVYVDTGQWVVQFVTKMTATSSNLFEFTADGTARKIVVGWNFATQQFSVDMTNSAGGSVYSQVWPFVAADITGRFISITFGMGNSGTDFYNMDYQIHGDTTNTIHGVGDLVAGSKGRITGGQLGASTTATTVFGHLGVFTDPAYSQGIDSYYNAAAMGGWAGEQMHNRVARVCTQASIPYSVTATRSTVLGPEPRGTIVDVLRDGEHADGGQLDDSQGRITYRALSEFVNQDTIALTIDASDRQLGGSLSATTDDQKTINRMKVSRTGGSEATFSAAVAGGPVYGASETKNVYADSQLLDHAGWTVWVHNRKGKRITSLTINLLTSYALAPSFLALKLGDRIRITNPPEHLGTTSKDLIFTGWATSTYSRRPWVVTANCVDYDPYEVGQWDSATRGKWDTAGSVLHTAVDATATTWDVATTSGPLWTTVDAEDGWPWYVDGEKVTVTDVAPSLVTYGAVGTAAHANNASVTPGIPAGVAAGNLLLCIAAIRNSGTGTVNTPAGYTAMVTAGNLVLLGKIATSAAEAAPTITFTGGVANADTSAQMIRVAGKFHTVAGALLAYARALNASGQDIAYPGLSNQFVDNALVLYIGWKQDDVTSIASPGTEIAEATTTTGDDQTLVWAYQIQTTSAYIPAGSFVVTGGAAAISRGVVVAIRCDYQTATVTRSVNAVAKAHAALTAVRLWQPMRWTR